MFNNYYCTLLSFVFQMGSGEPFIDTLDYIFHTSGVTTTKVGHVLIFIDERSTLIKDTHDYCSPSRRLGLSSCGRYPDYTNPYRYPLLLLVL